MLTNREKFLYIATSISFSPQLDGIDKTTKTTILKKVCKDMGITEISNKDVADLFYSVETLRTPFGFSLLKFIDRKSFETVRNTVLSNKQSIDDAIKQIKDNPDLLKQITEILKTQ